jgi:hypothetical protein
MCWYTSSLKRLTSICGCSGTGAGGGAGLAAETVGSSTDGRVGTAKFLDTGCENSAAAFGAHDDGSVDRSRMACDRVAAGRTTGSAAIWRSRRFPIRAPTLVIDRTSRRVAVLRVATMTP